MPTSLSDLVLLRRAINQDWPVSAAVRQAIVDELGEGLESNDVRRTISIARTFIAMDWASHAGPGNEGSWAAKACTRVKLALRGGIGRVVSRPRTARCMRFGREFVLRLRLETPASRGPEAQRRPDRWPCL